MEKNTHPHVARIRTASKSCPQQLHLSQPQAQSLPRGPPWDLPFAGCDPAGRPRVYLAASFFATCAGAGGENFLGSRLQTKVQLTLTKTLQLRSWESWERVFQTILGSTVISGCWSHTKPPWGVSSRLSELPKDSAFEHSSRLLAKNSSHPWTPTHWGSGVWRSGRDSINPGWFESSQLARIVDYLMSFPIKSYQIIKRSKITIIFTGHESKVFKKTPWIHQTQVVFLPRL